MATGILDNIKEAVQASLNVSQMKNLTTPIIIDGSEYSTVETALNAINSKSVDVDDELSSVSENPIQNKVITEEINKKLTVVDNMPTASAEFVGKQRLYVGESSGGLNKGGIYECRSDGNSGYEWVLISTAGVDLSKYKKIFTGTMDEWDELTPAEQAQYDFIATPDEANEELHNKVYTLLSTSVTTTDTNYTLMLNRKLSDYDYLIIQQLDATSVRNSYIVHLNQFESKRVILSSLHGANSANASDYSVSTINVRYVDDTTISAYATGSAMVNTLEILGVKITM